jgi:DNA-binding transcriptional LysR family regulator
MTPIAFRLAGLPMIHATAIGTEKDSARKMDLRQLEYFVAVAEERHFARAAAKLHVAQPSVSQQIKSLEQEFGVALFARTSRAVALTPAGSEILPLATQLLADARRLQQYAEQSARRLAGRVRIGFLADEYTHPQGDQLIGAIRQEHPRLEMEFQQIDFTEQYSALEDAQVDVAFVMGPVPDSFVSVPLSESPRLLAVSRVSARSVEQAAGPADFSGASAVLPNRVASNRWRRAWTPPTADSAHVFVVGESSMEAMLAAVGAGRGVCVVPEYVSRYYPQPGVSFLEIPGIGPCSVELAALRSRQHEPLVAALVGVARSLDTGLG